jgi:hypothetical protein
LLDGHVVLRLAVVLVVVAARCKLYRLQRAFLIASSPEALGGAKETPGTQ